MDDPNKEKLAGEMPSSPTKSENADHADVDVDRLETMKPVEQSKEPEIPPVSFFKLLSTADRLDKVLMIGGTIGALGHGCLMPLFAIVFGEFTNAFGDMNSIDFVATVSSIALKFTYLAIAALFGAFFQSFCWIWTGNRQTNRLRERYLASVLKQEVAFFDVQASSGSLLQGLNEDSLAVQAAIGDKLALFMQHMTTFLVGYLVAFSKGWDMTLVMLGVLPFLAIIGAILAKMISYLTDKSTAAYTKAGDVVSQSLSQIRTVAAFNRERESLSQYERELETPVKSGIKQGVVSGMAIGAVQFVMYCSYAVALVYGVFRITEGEYDGGVLFATLLGGFSLGQAAPVVANFAKGRSSGARLFKTIERQPEVSDGETPAGGHAAADSNGTTANGHAGGDKPNGQELQQVVVQPAMSSVRGDVELRDVVFAYPARPDILVFRHFNLVVPAGKTIALVGSSGSGKSTVVSLIERFYDPLSGTVLLDGVDLRNLSLKWLRQQVGLVSQEPTLFATTILENICMGREGGASREDVIAAAQAANAHKFISNLPDGYDTQVGERGVQLSGGQKQRIAIARAVLKNPKVLLLDEATSALDTTSERIVQAALDKMTVGRTTVVIAHRLSTVQNADIIAVVQNGNVVEQGTHAELLKNPNGAYTNLVQLQMQREAEDQRAGAVPEVDEATVAEAEEVLGAGAVVNMSNQLSIPVSIGSDPLGRVSQSGSVMPKHGSQELPAKEAAAAAAHVAGETADGKEGKEEDEKNKAPVKVPFSRLFALNKPELPYMIVGSIASAAAGVQHPAFAFVLSSMVTLFYEPDFDYMKSRASFYCWMFFVIACGALISLAIQQYCFGIVGQQLGRRVRILLFGAMLRQEVAWFDDDEHSSGKLASALSSDASCVRGAVGDTMGLILQNLTTLACGYLIAFAYDWRMALLVTGVLPLLIVAMFIQMKMFTGATSKSDKIYAGANQAISEAFGSIRVIMAYNLQGYMSRLYRSKLDGADKEMMKQAWMAGLAMGYAMFTMFAMYGLIIYFGGQELSHGWVDFEGMLQAFIAVLLAAMGLAQAGVGFPDVGKAKAAVDRIFPIIDRVPKIDSSSEEGARPDPSTVRGEVSFECVRFVYPNRPKVVIFRDFSLQIPAGKVCALVGESGSGKSTVVGLLERFYDPLAGRVLLDGVDIRQINVRHLRSLIGLVSQEPLLFNGTIGDNIRFGRPDASEEQVLAAVQAANALEFVKRLPDGLNTKVGEGGIQLSGGQKQRVAIARAVVKDPKIMLLDEATSALDARSERVVQQALDRIMVGRTSLVIAHRLSTIRNADLISVVYRGIILEQGTHDQLMALPQGSYKRLVNAQQQGA